MRRPRRARRAGARGRVAGWAVLGRNGPGRAAVTWAGSGWAVLVWALVLAAGGCRPPAERPNIVVILADDLGWRDLGVQGSRYFRTPRVDALAAGGLRFTQAYVNGPNCAPSRASLMTGRYTPRHGVYSVVPNARGRDADRRLVPAPDRSVLDTSFVTVAEVLRRGGYRTGLFGKWHLGDEGFLPADQGFDVGVGGDGLGATPTHFAPYRRRGRALRDLGDTGDAGEYLADRLTDEAVRFIRDSRDRPFFLFLSHYAVHTPIEIDSARAAPFAGLPPDGAQRDPRYAGMVAAVDESVGRVLDALDAEGIADRTLVVFLSDNGGVERFTDARPLRGGKGMLYEGGIRVPMIVRWPGRTPPGRTSDLPVIASDLLATFAEAAGAAAPPTDGVSLVPAFEGGAIPDRPLFWHFPAYLEGTPGPWRTTPASAIRSGGLKLVHFFEDDRDELYDLAADPGETTDLSAARSDETRRLRGLLEAWWRETGAFLPSEANPSYDPGG